MSEYTLVEQIAQAIYQERDAINRVASEKTVARVVLDTATYSAFLRGLNSIAYLHHYHFREGEPTEVRVRGVPVIARADAEPGFTLETAQVLKFRA